MGFFGGLGKRLKDGRIADGLAAAQAALGGDYATAQRIQEAGRERRQQAKQVEQLRSVIKRDPTLQQPEIETLISNPILYEQVVLQRLLESSRKQPQFPVHLVTTADGVVASDAPGSSLANSGRCLVRSISTPEEWEQLDQGEIYCSPNGRVMRKR
jgi:hypothetical protein